LSEEFYESVEEYDPEDIVGENEMEEYDSEQDDEEPVQEEAYGEE
jgi:hypothetical protein